MSFKHCILIFVGIVAITLTYICSVSETEQNQAALQPTWAPFRTDQTHCDLIEKENEENFRTKPNPLLEPPPKAWRPANIQTEFSIETSLVPIQHPVPIPYQVLQLLKRHEYLVEVSDCLKQQMQEKKSFDQYLEYWLTASVIDLNEDGLDEMIVQVSEQYNFCLIGAGRGPFWVFQQAPEGYRLIFHTSAHDLKVLAAKAKGFHQLNIQAMTALELLTGTYEFDGSEYDSVTGSEHYGTIPIKQKFRKEIALALATNALVVLAWTQNVDYRPTLKEALHGNPEKLLILLKLTLNLNEKNHKNHVMILWRLLHFVGDKAFVSAFQKLSQPERVAVTKALTETSYTVRNPDDYLKLLFPQTHQVLFPEVTDSKAKA